MGKKRPSIKDIASKLNVSPTTISFVLNGKAKEKKISDGLAKRVLHYVDEVNYKPNQLAQSLRTGRSKILVFMVEDISNHFFAKLARAIEDIAYQMGYNVLFCSNENKDRRSIELINLFKDRQVDGFIIIPSIGIKENIKALIEENIPVVLFDRYFPDLETSYVVIDNEHAAYNATVHLIKNQFQNIGFVTLDVEQTQMRDRLQGYKKAVKDFKVGEHIQKIPYQQKTSINKKIIHDFLLNNQDLDAIFFATNYLTQSGLEAIKENFPHLIDRLGIVTFDDHELFKTFNPSISAVSQPIEDIAKKLMMIMSNLLKDPSRTLPVEKIVLESKFQDRNSSIAGKTSSI